MFNTSMLNKAIDASFFNKSSDKQRRNKSSLYYGIKRGAGVAKYSGLLATTCLVGLAVTQNKAMAAPTGGNVVGGNANITVSGTQTNINQTTNRAAIDWQSFSVAADESVNFTVPNGGATLNRVVGSQASLIQGRVSSNGSLYLVNPNGLVLDAGSQISAQNFIATTSNIDPAQFMTGDHVTLQKSSTNARISLKGTITVADRGVVGIFAPKVENQGTIIANLGSVVLAGSQASVIDFNGDGLINFELGASDGRTGESLLASNKGVINAAGGHVTLTAQGAESLFNAVVENSGTINATSLSAKGGTVTLKANLGSVNDSGTIEASGATGGGNVLVWASENAKFTGNIKAEALSNSQNIISNGGAVEISGIKYLNFNGLVSTLSHNGGKTGTLLLDPSDITISNGTDTDSANASNSFTGSAATSIINVTTLVTALGTNNIIIDATGGSGTSTTSSITVANDVVWTSGKNLTLTAGSGGIAINAKINGGTTGNLTMTSGGNITEGAAGIIIANTVSASSTGGNIVLDNAANSMTKLGAITVGTTNKSITIVNNRALTLTGAVSTANNATNTGNISITTAKLNADDNGKLTINNTGGITWYGTGALNLTLDIGGMLFNGNINGGTTGILNIDTKGQVTNNSGFVTAGTLNFTGRNTAGSVLNNASLLFFGENHVGKIGNITGATGNADFRVDNYQDIVIDGVVNWNGTLRLNSVGGSITQNANSTITATAIDFEAFDTFTTYNNVTLGNNGNRISRISTLYAKDFTLVNSGNLEIGLGSSGSTAVHTIISGTANITTTATTGANAQAGNFTQTQGLAAGTLNLTVAGAVNLTNRGNDITTLGTLSFDGTKDFGIASFHGTGLTINNNITTTGDVTLILGGGGVTFGANKKITANSLTGSAASNVNLTTSINNLGDFTITNTQNAERTRYISNYQLTVTNDKALNILGTVSNLGGTVNLAVTGAINTTAPVAGRAAVPASQGVAAQPAVAAVAGGKIIADKLIGSATDSVAILGNITNLGNFGVGSGNNFSLTNDNGFTIIGAVGSSAARAGVVTLKTLAGDINTSTEASPGIGSITAASLAVESAGAATLKGLTLTGAITGHVAGNVLISGVYTGNSGLQQTANGSYIISNATSFTVSNTSKPNRAQGVTGDVGFIATGTGNFVTLSEDVDFGAFSLTLGSDEALTLNHNITTTGKLNLTSKVGISNTGFKINAGTISGSAGGAVNLATNVTNLGDFTVTNGANLTITNDKALVVNGAVNLTAGTAATAGNVSLTTTGNVNNVGNSITTSTVANAVGSITAQNVTLTSAGLINVSNLSVNGTLTGSAAGAVTLGGSINLLGAITQSAIGAFAVNATGNLVVTNAPTRTGTATGAINYNVTGSTTSGGVTTYNTITIGGQLNFGASDVSFNSSGAIAVNSNVTTTGNISLISSNGGITNLASTKITAATLTGSANGNVSLITSITNLGNFTITNNTNTLTLNNDKALNISGVVKATNNNADISINTVTLNVTGGGITTANTGNLKAIVINGSATDKVTLKGSIDSIGNFSVTNNRDFELTSAVATRAGGALNVGTGNVSITTTQGDITTNNATITANNLTLTSAGAINMSGLALSGSITGSAKGAVTLGGSFASLGAFTQSVSGAFTVTNARSLTISAAPTRTNGATGLISYSVTGASNTLTTSGALNFIATDVSFSSEGALVISNAMSSTGVISLTSTSAGISGSGLVTAGTLNVTAADNVSLTTSLTNLGVVSVTGTSKNFTLSNNKALNIAKAVIVTGAVSLTTTNGGAITTGANGSITAASLAVTSAGAASLSGLNISGAVTGTVNGAVTLDGTFGSYSGLQQTANGTFTLKSSQNLTNLVAPTRKTGVTGAVVIATTGTGTISFFSTVNFDANNVSISSDAELVIDQNLITTGNLYLSSKNGSVKTFVDSATPANSKKITANILTGSAGGAVNLAGSVATLGAFTQTASGDFTLKNDRNLLVTAAPTRTNNATGTIEIEVTGSTTANNAVNYNTLTVNAVLTTGAANLSLKSSGALAINNNLTTTGTVSVSSTNGAIILAGGRKITADILIGSANSTTNDVFLTTNVNKLGAFTVANGKNLTIINDKALTVTGAVALSAAATGVNPAKGNVTLQSLVGGITGTGGISANNLTLTSAEAINLSGLTLTGTVSGTARGAVTLDGSIATLGGFVQFANGNFSVTNSRSMVVSVAPVRIFGVSGNISYNVTGAGNILELKSNINNGAANVSLRSDGALAINGDVVTTGNVDIQSDNAGITMGTGKVIAANTLTGKARGSVTLNTNISNLGAFTVNAPDNLNLGNIPNLTLTNNNGFTITGVVSNAVTGGYVKLISSLGGINTTPDGRVDAEMLIGSAAGEVNLATRIDKLNTFTVTGNNNLSIANDRALSVIGLVSAKDGTVKLSTNSGGLTLNNSIDNSITATTVNLVGWAGINGSLGKIKATTLMGSNISAAVTLNTNITNLNLFTVNNSNFALTNDGALNVIGAVSAGTGNISLATTGALALNASLSGADISLTAGGAGGAISQAAAANVTASGTLSASTAGAVALTATGNSIAKLGAITGSSITINNARALSLTGDIVSTGGAITINNSFGDTDAKKAITVAPATGTTIIVSGGDILFDLGGGTSGNSHTSGGGVFDAGNNLLKTYGGTQTAANASNLTILADSFSLGATGSNKNFDVGSAKLSTVTGKVTFVDDRGVLVLGSNTDVGGVTYQAKSNTYGNVKTGGAIASADLSKVTGTVISSVNETDVNFTGDIYVNGATVNFTSITSTGGRVYFVGAYTDANNLIVSAGNGIAINAALNVGANKLTLTTGRGGVVGSGVITAGTLTTTNDAAIASVTGSGVVGGINLSGENVITKLGDLTNSGGGGISIKNSKATQTDVAENAIWSNKNGMIIVKLTTGNLNLLGDMTVATGTTALRVDLGASANITSSTGTNTISGKGVDVYYSGKSDGNGVKFNLGATAAVGSTPAFAGGVFTHVADATPKSGSSETIDKAYTVPVTTSFLSLGATSGITVVNNDGTTPSSQPLGKGLRFGSAVAVTIDGNWGAATATNNGSLRWIEGGTINVKPNASFAGSIVLAATGSAATPTIAGNATTNDIFANLYVAGNLTAAKDVILLQTGNVTPPALLASGKTASNAPGADAYGIYVGGAVTATSGSVIMAQTGAVTANSGSAWGIKANNIIYGKIGVDIYNGGAVTAAQTLSNLSVSAYGVQLIGAVWTGGNLAANSVGINNNGDVKANILSDATAYGSMAASVFTTSATNSADATINANAAAEAVRALNAAIAGTAAGSKPSISITVSGTATTYDLSTTLGYNNAYAASVTKYKNENASLKTNLINSNKATLLFAGKAVSATGVSTGNVTSGSVSIGNNANVTDNVDVSGAAITSSKIPTVSSTGLALGVLTASQGRVVVSHAGAVSGITSATGINLASATGKGVANVGKRVTVNTNPATITTPTASVTGGVAVSAFGSVTSNSTSGASKGIAAGVLTGSVGAMTVTQTGNVMGGVSATGVSLTNVNATGSVGTIQTKVETSGANTTTTVTTTDTVLGNITIGQSGDVTAGAGHAMGISGAALTGSLGSVNVSQDGAVTGTGGAATGINLAGAVTATNALAVPGATPAAAAVTNKTDYLAVTGGVSINQAGDVHATGAGASAKAIAAIAVNGASGVAVTQNGNVTGKLDAYGIYAAGALGSTHGTVSVSNEAAKTIRAETGRAFGINLLGGVSTAGSVVATRDGSITVAQKSTVTADKSSATGLNIGAVILTTGTNGSTVNLSNSGNVTANQSKDNRSVSATGIMTAFVSGGNLATNHVTITNSGVVTANNFNTAAENALAQDLINSLPGQSVTATGVNATTTLSGGKMNISNSGDVTHGTNVTARNYIVSATGINLTGNQIAGAALTITQSGAITGLTSAMGVNEAGFMQAIKGDLTVQSTGAKEVKAETGLSTSGTATGLNLIGTLLANAGKVTVSQDGNVTGVLNATGINLLTASATGVANVSKTVQINSATASASMPVTAGVASGVSISETGNVTSNSTVGTSKGINVIAGVTATLGKVEITQESDVAGGVLASGITLSGVTSTGSAERIDSSVGTSGIGEANIVKTTTLTKNDAVVGGITIRQNGAVTGNNGDANGIVGYGALTAINGAVSVKTAVDSTLAAAVTSKTIRAMNGKAFGMNLVAPVSTVSINGFTGEAGITVAQNATITSDNSSATGLNTGAVILANGTTSSTVNLSNSGNVTANQSKANRSVSATGISTVYVYGGNLSGNHVTITNSGVVTAINVSDTTADSYLTDTGVRAGTDARAVTSFDLAAQAAADKAINDAIAANQTSISVGGNTKSISNATDKTATRTAYITWYKDSRATELTNLKQSNAAQYILNGSVVTATGVNAGTTLSGGAMTITNSNDVSHGTNKSALNYVASATGINLTGNQIAGAALTVTQSGAITGNSSAMGVNEAGLMQAIKGTLTVQSTDATKEVKVDTTATTFGTATGLNLNGTLLANAGQIIVNHDGKVTGVLNATGINLLTAIATGVAQVTRGTGVNTTGVLSGLTITVTGDVSSNETIGTSKGINVIAGLTATNGIVTVTQNSSTTTGISGGVLASGITLGGVTSTGVVASDVGTGVGRVVTSAAPGGIVIRQNSHVTGNTGGANGILVNGAITAINGTVTVKTGVDTIGAITASATAKTINAKAGKAFGINLVAPVSTVGYVSTVDASITVGQYTTVTAEKGSATGLNAGAVILANGTTTSKVDLSNNGAVTANQGTTPASLSVSATGVATIYVAGGNLATNNVSISNNKAVTANNISTSQESGLHANSVTVDNTLRANSVTATGVNVGTVLSGGAMSITNSGDVSHGDNKSARNYTVSATGINLVGNQIAGTALTVTQSGAITGNSSAMGVNEAGLMQAIKGNLTVESTGAKEVKVDTTATTFGTATGLNLNGTLLANAGQVIVNHDGKVTGVTSATGINLLTATAIGVARVTRPVGGTINAVTSGVSISEKGDVTAHTSTGTAKGINVISGITVTNGTVTIAQDGDVSGGILASGITLAGVTTIGTAQTSSGPANALTTNYAVAGNITIRQNGDVTGNAGDANGILVNGAITAINGTVTVKTAVDSTPAAAVTSKTVLAKTGKAFGINLVAPVTTVGHTSDVVASIIIAQNATVTAEKSSATGLSVGAVTLAYGTNGSVVDLSNKGAVNATQSKLNLSVTATGVATGFVLGGNVSGNNITIKNTKNVTANNIATADENTVLETTVAATKTNLLANQNVKAIGVSVVGATAGGAIDIANNGNVTNGSNLTDRTNTISATGINILAGLTASLGKVTVDQTGLVTGVTSATGISMISATGTGRAEVRHWYGQVSNTLDVSAITGGVSISGGANGNVSASGATSTAKGIVVTGNLIGTLGAVSVTHNGTVSGGASATGISVVNVNSYGSVRKDVIIVSPSNYIRTYDISGDITINQVGAVSASAGSATGVVGNALTATSGSVSVLAGAVTGVSSATTGAGNTATGINLTGVTTATRAAGYTQGSTNFGALEGSVSLNQTGDVIVNGSGTVGEAKAIVTSVLSGASGVSVLQNGAVTGKSDAYGILVNGAILSNSGVVRVKSGVSLITDTTVPATAKIITAKNGKAYGIKLADVNTARAVGVTADGSITVGQYATVTADKSSATGVTLANVILANGTANSTINLSNNGAVTAKQSVANPLVTAIGVAVNGAVVGGNMAGNNVTITNAGVVAAKTSADVIVPTSSFDIKAVASITANTVGNTLSLNAIGNIDATGAVIIAKTVTASSGTAVNVGGKVSLNNGGNQIANFGAITAGSFDIGSAIDFNLTGDLTKTSTVASDPMKLSNYGSGKNIGISSNINANRASGGDQLTFKFTGTGKFLTTAGQGNIHYVNAGVAESPDLNGTSLNARLTTAVANSVVVTNK